MSACCARARQIWRAFGVLGETYRWWVAGTDAACDGVVPAGVLLLAPGPLARASSNRNSSRPPPPVPATTAMVRGLMDRWCPRTRVPSER